MNRPATRPDRATALLRQAIDHRRVQRMGEAAGALSLAAEIAPDDREIAFLTAQLAYERGFPAADLFARAHELWPDNIDILRNRALALASDGAYDAAEFLLQDALALRPGWLDGQKVLASLRWTGAKGAAFDLGYAEATAREPENTALWLAWFAAVMQIRDWERAGDILDQAETALGKTAQLRAARTVLAAEAHDDATAHQGFAELASMQDDALNLARVRFLLRTGRPSDAQDVALPLLARPVAPQVWPYLSLVWRLLGDRRAAWLDGTPPHVAEVDPGFSESELVELAGGLRSLHTAIRPYADQSVRGGTQTDRSVLLRHEPWFENARLKLMAAVEGFVATLPPPDPRHPLLARPRDELAIAGSWSVRIGPGGRNVAHTHPRGWLSSAFYVALPVEADAGSAPAGNLRLGVAPAELEVDLSPHSQIVPTPGKLALFPSTMWHDTVPIIAGERLNIAFDVVPLAAAPQRNRTGQ